MNNDLDKEFDDKLQSLTMFKNLSKEHGSNFTRNVIIGYLKALHRYFGIPDTDDIIKVAMVSAIGDIKFEGSYIVFTKKDGSLWERVYAPC